MIKPIPDDVRQRATILTENGQNPVNLDFAKERAHVTSAQVSSQQDYGRAVVTICGRDYYLGKYGSKESKQAYKRLIAEWESTGRSTAFGAAQAKATVAMLISDYRDWANSYYPMNGKDSEAKQIVIASEWLADYEDLPVSKFGPLRLKAVREAMINATGKHGKPLSRGYINDLIERIRRMFGWGSRTRSSSRLCTMRSKPLGG